MQELKKIPKKITDIDVLAIKLGEKVFIAHRFNSDFFSEATSSPKYTYINDSNNIGISRSIDLISKTLLAFEESLPGLPIENRKKARVGIKEAKRLVGRAKKKRGFLVSIDDFESFLETAGLYFDNFKTFNPENEIISINNIVERYGAEEIAKISNQLTDFLAQRIDDNFAKNKNKILAQIKLPQLENAIIPEQQFSLKQIFLSKNDEYFCVKPEFGDIVYQSLIEEGWEYGYRSIENNSLKCLYTNDPKKMMSFFVFLNEHPELKYISIKLNVLEKLLTYTNYPEFRKEEEKKNQKTNILIDSIRNKLKSFKYPLKVKLFIQNKTNMQNANGIIYIKNGSFYVKPRWGDTVYNKLRHDFGWTSLKRGTFKASKDVVAKYEGLKYIFDTYLSEYKISYSAFFKYQKLVDAALAEKQKRLKNITKSRATDVDKDLKKPDSLEYMGFQKAGIEFALRNNNILIGDEMGLGKTIQGLGIINNQPEIKKALIVCPKSLKLNWKQEAEKWLINKNLSIGLVNPTKKFPDTDIVIVNYDVIKKFSKDIKKTEWDIVICDEAHALKNPKAQRTYHFLGNKKEKIAPVETKQKVALTGTPSLNRPVELFTLLNWLRPDIFSDYMSYVKKYCDAKNNGYGLDVSGASNLEELQEKLRSSVMVRRLKSQVLKDMPPKSRQTIPLEVTGTKKIIKDSQKIINEIQQRQQKLFLAKISGTQEDYFKELKKIGKVDGINLEDVARLRKEIGVKKIPALIELLQEYVNAGEKVVCFGHHHEVIEKIHEHFKDVAVKHYGVMNEEQKNDSVNRFQNDPDCLIFVGSIKASGVGLTLTAASNAMFLEYSYVPGEIFQCEDRIHRIGQENNVLIKCPYIPNTIEGNMLNAIVEKKTNCDSMLDNDFTISGFDILDKTNDKSLIENIKSTLPDAYNDTQETDSVNDKQKTNETIIDSKKKNRDLFDKPLMDYGFADLESFSKCVTIEMKQRVENGLRIVSSMCDGAVKTDSIGFSAADAYVGNFLSGKESLNQKETLAGAEMLIKYKKQLGEELQEQILNDLTTCKKAFFGQTGKEEELDSGPR
jgi:SNF2 family DNA or RNA helicase